MGRVIKGLCIAALCFVAISCASKTGNENKISSIQLIDRNGFNETISSESRLAKLEKANYLEPQPYQKVVRAYGRNKEGKLITKITTYHDNGTIWQYLETVNGRANGVYKEWYPNETLRMVANVIEGIGDLSPESQATWVFDKKSKVWEEGGSLLAEIQYDKGMLTDQSVYYYASGAVAKIIPYRKDKIEGILKVFGPTGDIIGTTSYGAGKKDGLSIFKGNASFPRREEEYKEGKLLSGKYWDFRGNVIAEVVDGRGIKPMFENGVIKIEQEYKNGIPMGEVKTYRENGNLESVYSIVDNQKQGEEWCYYDRQSDGETLQPMLFINWKDDEIHGLVRAWYENGTLECEKEMAHNKKNGTLIAWYEEGSLMMVEEYENDALLKGKYFKKGEDTPTSKVVDGKGCATIFDKEGKFLRKIEYQKGWPVE